MERTNSIDLYVDPLAILGDRKKSWNARLLGLRAYLNERSYSADEGLAELRQIKDTLNKAYDTYTKRKIAKDDEFSTLWDQTFLAINRKETELGKQYPEQLEKLLHGHGYARQPAQPAKTPWEYGLFAQSEQFQCPATYKANTEASLVSLCSHPAAHDLSSYDVEAPEVPTQSAASLPRIRKGLLGTQAKSPAEIYGARTPVYDRRGRSAYGQNCAVSPRDIARQPLDTRPARKPWYVRMFNAAKSLLR